eukprot:13890549-Ditylum_brightwellii.AAC.1
MIRGKRSHMTQERVDVLDSAGFCWDPHEASWWDKLKELQEYKEEFGDCMEGKVSHMNEKRARALEELGFVHSCARQMKEKAN